MAEFFPMLKYKKKAAISIENRKTSLLSCAEQIEITLRANFIHINLHIVGKLCELNCILIFNERFCIFVQ